MQAKICKPKFTRKKQALSNRNACFLRFEMFETLNGKLELYRLLDEGHAAVKEGRKRPLADVMRDIKRGITNAGE